MKPTLLIAIMTVASSFIAAQEGRRAKSLPGRNGNNPVTGAELYRMYCAACHGAAGRGDGPAAAALKSRPADLTTISRRNGGEFPERRIVQMIQGYQITAAHGSRDLPVWGGLLHDQSRNDATSNLRQHDLVEYVRSIQR